MTASMTVCTAQVPVPITRLLTRCSRGPRIAIMYLSMDRQNCSARQEKKRGAELQAAVIWPQRLQMGQGFHRLRHGQALARMIHQPDAVYSYGDEGPDQGDDEDLDREFSPKAKEKHPGMDVPPAGDQAKPTIKSSQFINSGF